jgi:hypothetical protein
MVAFIQIKISKNVNLFSLVVVFVSQHVVLFLHCGAEG